MKILLTSKGTDWNSQIDSRFGRCDYLFIYDEESSKIESFDNTQIKDQAHGAGPKTASKMAEYGVNILITGNGPGGNASKVLEKMNVEIFVGASDMTLKQAYDAYKKNELKKI